MDFAKIMSLAVAAILVENYVLVQFLGCCPFLGVSKKVETAGGMGMAVIFVMTIASAATWLINRYVLVQFGLEYMQTVAFILVIAALVQLVEMFLMKSMPALYQALGIYLPLITTNCAVLGAALTNVQDGNTLLESVVYGASAAIGFTLAIVLFAGVREQMEFADIPESFQGFPIALVSASLLAISFMGFQGLKIW